MIISFINSILSHINSFIRNLDSPEWTRLPSSYTEYLASDNLGSVIWICYWVRSFSRDASICYDENQISSPSLWTRDGETLFKLKGSPWKAKNTASVSTAPLCSPPSIQFNSLLHPPSPLRPSQPSNCSNPSPCQTFHPSQNLSKPTTVGWKYLRQSLVLDRLTISFHHRTGINPRELHPLHEAPRV